MFRPERMNEVNFFIFEEAIQPVVLALARLGTIQIEDESGAQGGARQTHWATNAATYAAQERRLRELIDALGLTPPAATLPPDIDLEEDHARTNQLLDEAGLAIDAWRSDVPRPPRRRSSCASSWNRCGCWRRWRCRSSSWPT